MHTSPAASNLPQQSLVLHLNQVIQSCAQRVFEHARLHPNLDDRALAKQFELHLKQSEGSAYPQMVQLIARLAKAPQVKIDLAPLEAFKIKLYQIFAETHPVVSRRTFLGWLGALGATTAVSHELGGLAAKLFEQTPAVVAPVPSPSFILGFNESTVLPRVTSQIGQTVLGANPEPSIGMMLRHGVLSHWNSTVKAGLNALRGQSDAILLGEALSSVPGAILATGQVHGQFGDLVHAHVIGGDLLKDPALHNFFSALRRAQTITTQLGPSSKLRHSEHLSKLANRVSNVSPEELAHILSAHEQHLDVRVSSQYLPSDYIDGLPAKIYLLVQDPCHLNTPKVVVLEEPRWDLPRGTDDLMCYRVFVMDPPTEAVPAESGVVSFKERHFERLDSYFVGTANLVCMEDTNRPLRIHEGKGFRPMPIFHRDQGTTRRAASWLIDVVRDALQSEVLALAA